MRKIAWLVLLFCVSCGKEKAAVVHHPSKVDSLETIRQVEDFVRLLGEDFDEFELKSIADMHRGDPFPNDSVCADIAKKLRVAASYYKTDIDGNGYSDMLIFGDNNKCNSVAIDEGEKSYSCDFSTYLLLGFANDSIRPIDLSKVKTKATG